MKNYYSKLVIPLCSAFASLKSNLMEMEGISQAYICTYILVHTYVHTSCFLGTFPFWEFAFVADSAALSGDPQMGLGLDIRVQGEG